MNESIALAPLPHSCSQVFHVGVFYSAVARSRFCQGLIFTHHSVSRHTSFIPPARLYDDLLFVTGWCGCIDTALGRFLRTSSTLGSTCMLC